MRIGFLRSSCCALSVEIWLKTHVAYQGQIRVDPYASQRLVKYAKTNCSPKIVSWMFKNRDRLAKLIDDVWAWEEVDACIEGVATSRYQRVLDALRWPCVCQMRWLHHVRESFAVNRVCEPELCSSVLQSLQEGRSEAFATVTGAGCGKMAVNIQSIVPSSFKNVGKSTEHIKLELKTSIRSPCIRF